MTDIEKNVQHPIHYGGDGNPYEVVKVLKAWGLDGDAYLWNVAKYIARAGKKDGNSAIQDLKKARWYLDYKINLLMEDPQDDVKTEIKSNVEVAVIPNRDIINTLSGIQF